MSPPLRQDRSSLRAFGRNQRVRCALTALTPMSSAAATPRLIARQTAAEAVVLLEKAVSLVVRCGRVIFVEVSFHTETMVRGSHPC